MTGVDTTTTNTSATCYCSQHGMGEVMRSLSIHAPEGVKPK